VQVSVGEASASHLVVGEGANVFNGSVVVSTDGFHVYLRCRRGDCSLARRVRVRKQGKCVKRPHDDKKHHEKRNVKDYGRAGK
jgi:hypothetical protein